jgi:hypothetical protein
MTITTQINLSSTASGRATWRFRMTANCSETRGRWLSIATEIQQRATPIAILAFLRTGTQNAAAPDLILLRGGCLLLRETSSVTSSRWKPSSDDAECIGCRVPLPPLAAGSPAFAFCVAFQPESQEQQPITQSPQRDGMVTQSAIVGVRPRRMGALTPHKGTQNPEATHRKGDAL